VTGEGSPADEAIISQWSAHWSRTRQLAAALARELAALPDHSRIEPTTKTAARHGVSYSVALSARNLLIGAKLAYKRGAHCYKAATTRNGTGR
jgi:hypothetical protein